MANPIDAILHIGKEGVTDNVIKQAYDALEARELIKGKVQKNAPVDAREAMDMLCEKLGASPVQAIGQIFVLFRESNEHKKISLTL